MDEEQITTEYRTKDLHEAAFINCIPGAIVKDLDRQQREGKAGKPTVYFKMLIPLSRDELSQLLFDYSNRQATVDPLTFVERINSLRDLMFRRLETEVRHG